MKDNGEDKHKNNELNIILEKISFQNKAVMNKNYPEEDRKDFQSGNLRINLSETKQTL